MTKNYHGSNEITTSGHTAYIRLFFGRPHTRVFLYAYIHASFCTRIYACFLDAYIRVILYAYIRVLILYTRSGVNLFSRAKLYSGKCRRRWRTGTGGVDV